MERSAVAFIKNTVTHALLCSDTEIPDARIPRPSAATPARTSQVMGGHDTCASPGISRAEAQKIAEIPTEGDAAASGRAQSGSPLQATETPPHLPRLVQDLGLSKRTRKPLAAKIGDCETDDETAEATQAAGASVRALRGRWHNAGGVRRHR
ncbi:unnamed protein product [Lampetra fluviatilis]